MEGLDALNEEQIVDDEDFEAVRPRLMEKIQPLKGYPLLNK